MILIKKRIIFYLLFLAVLSLVLSLVIPQVLKEIILIIGKGSNFLPLLFLYSAFIFCESLAFSLYKKEFSAFYNKLISGQKDKIIQLFFQSEYTKADMISPDTTLEALVHDCSNLINLDISSLGLSIIYFFQTTIIFVLLAKMNWILGLCILFIYIFYIIFSFLFRNKRIHELEGKRNNDKLIEQNIVETINRWSDIKSLGVDKIKKNLNIKFQNRWIEKIKKIFIVENTYRNIPRIYEFLIPAIVLLFATFYGNFDVANIIMIFVYVQLINQSMKVIVGSVSQFTKFNYYYSQVRSTIKKLINISSEKKEVQYYNTIESLQLSDVSYSDILKECNIRLYSGQIVGLIGKSGSGKSTILRILSKLISPTKGKYLQNGKEVKSSRLYLSYIPQEMNLFSTTILENITYFTPKYVMSDINEILEVLNLTDTVNRIGIKGSIEMLSGGEKQRIIIARELLSNKDVLLFDEVFKNIDAQTVNNILRFLKKSIQHKILVYTTHNYEHLINADKLILVEQGRIADIIDNEKINLDKIKKFLEG